MSLVTLVKDTNTNQQVIYIYINTYTTNFLKVSSMTAKMDKLLVEKPCKLELQWGVVGHLTGQNNALTHCNVQCWRRSSDYRGLCNNQAELTILFSGQYS